MDGYVEAKRYESNYLLNNLSGKITTECKLLFPNREHKILQNNENTLVNLMISRIDST